MSFIKIRNIGNAKMDNKEQQKISSQELEQFLSDFLYSRFKTNLDTFKKYFPDIASLFNNYQLKKPVEFFCTENGIPNAKIGSDKTLVYPAEDPIDYCKKQITEYLSTNVLKQSYYQNVYDPFGQIHYKYNNKIAQIMSYEQREGIKLKDLSSVPICVMVGVGLGYQLAELYERINILNFILVEPDLDLFYLSLHTFDWVNLLNFIAENNYGLNLILGKDSNSFELDFKRYFVGHGKFLSGTEMIIVHINNPENLALAKKIRENYNYIHSCLGFFDDHLFATSQTIHSLCNRKKFVIKGSLEKKYEEYPVFVIGSGPSLDKDIPFLKKYQDKAIIIACGSAIDVLYHVGIKPDFYANTERIPQIEQALSIIPDKSFFNDIILLCGDVCHPYTIDYFKHTAIFAKPDEPTFPYLFDYFDELRNIQEIQFTNPLVGNMGVSGAVHLGFKKLFLFGIDNGKKIGTESIHSQHTTLYKKRGNLEDDPIYVTDKTVEGNFGGKCLTAYYFEVSNKYIGETLVNNQLINTDGVTCYNCSDGAKIENTIPTHSDNIANMFEKMLDIDKTDFLNYVNNYRTASFDIKTNQIKKLFDKDEFITLCEEIKSILRSSHSSRIDCLFSMQDISERIFNATFNKQERYISQCLEGSIQSFFITTCRVLYAFSDEKKCIEEYDKLVDVICDFLTEAPILFGHLPDYIMGEHLKYFTNGKVGLDMPFCEAPSLPEALNIITKEYEDPVKKFIKQYS